MALANGGNSSLGPWFVAGPVLGGADKDTVVHATTAAEAEHYASLGYAGFATQAEADAAASGINANQQADENLSTANPIKSALSGILPSFTNTRSFMVRVVKVVIGGALILAGLTMLVKQETNISVGDVAKVAAL